MYPVSGSVKTVHFRTILFNAILLNKRYLLIWYTICLLKNKEITLSNRNHMKTVFLIITMLCLGLPGMAQNNEKKEFERKYSALTQEVANARKQKDYKKAEKLNWEKLKLYQGLPQQLQEKAKNITGLVYYDLACYQALQGKKKAALKNFEKAFNSGWNDYNHAKGDSDIDNLRKEKKYLEVMAKMRLDSDYLYILQQAEGYNRTETKPICYNESVTDTLPRFTYMNPNDSNLVQLRKHFNLDSIAGSGDEISKIKNLLYWVHNIVPHDGNSRNPEERNTIAMVELCKKENRGVNCRMMAQMLNECYLAMGFKSRFITCMPKVMINDCHVINAVYSNTLNKWLWMDPTFNAYVTDEKGNLLGIGEVRERLRNNQPVVLNEDANWNNKNKQTKEYYLDYYMAKNLYYVTCPLQSEYNAEINYPGKKWSMYISLVPEGYSTNGKPGATAYDSHNDSYFWQSPYQE